METHVAAPVYQAPLDRLLSVEERGSRLPDLRERRRGTIVVRRVRSASRLKPHQAAVRGSGMSPGTVDESETGSANSLRGFLCAQTRTATRLVGFTRFCAACEGGASRTRTGDPPDITESPSRSSGGATGPCRRVGELRGP